MRFRGFMRRMKQRFNGHRRAVRMIREAKVECRNRPQVAVD